MRDAEFRNTGAQNQYLIAIRSFIDSCYTWARFESTDQEYRNAKIALSRWAENTMTAEAYKRTLAQLKETFGQVPSAVIAPYGDGNPTLGNQPESADSGMATTQLDAIYSRLNEIYGRLPPPPSPTRPHPSTRPSALVRFGRGSAIPELQSLDEALKVAVSFTGSCQRPQIVLVGYADISGSQAGNAMLGLRRAAEVRDSLILRDASLGDVIAVSGGATARFGSNASDNRVVKVEMRCNSND